MQPETAVEARAWFQKATNDLRGADIDLAAVPPLIEDALFHCQQAAEKMQTLALARQVVTVLLDRLPPTIRP